MSDCLFNGKYLGILKGIEEHRPESKLELANKIDRSQPNVNTSVNNLIEDGYVKNKGSQRHSLFLTEKAKRILEAV